MPIGLQFPRVWPQAFSWTHYLRSVISHIHQQGSDLSEVADGSDVSTKFAESIAAFMRVSIGWTILYEKHFLNEDVFDFIVAYWAMKDVPREVSDQASEVFTNIQLSTLPESMWIYVFDEMLSHFESPQAIATLVLDRARVAQSKMDFESMAIHFDLLSLLIHKKLTHPISKAILAEKPVKLVVTSLLSILDAQNWAFHHRQRLVTLCLRIVGSILTYGDSGKHLIISQGLHCGLLEAYFRIGQEFNNSLGDAILIFKQIGPLSVFSKAVFHAAYRGFLHFSRKFGKRPFDIWSLQGGFRDSWSGLQRRILEHVVLQNMYARGIDTELVYCNNVRLIVFHTKYVCTNVIYFKVFVLNKRCSSIIQEVCRLQSCDLLLATLSEGIVEVSS